MEQQQPQTDERQGASQQGEVVPPEESPQTEPKNRRAEIRQARREAQEHARLLAENGAIKDVAKAVNGTCQLLAATLQGLILGRLDVQKIETADVALLVVYCEPGHELREEVVDQLMRLLKMPLVTLPKTMKVEGVKPEILEKAGWTRLGPRSVVDVQGQPISK